MQGRQLRLQCTAPMALQGLMMMSGHISRYIDKYLDGALPARRAASVDAHLRECARCRRELQALRSARMIARELPSPPLSAGFVDRVCANLPPQPAPKGFWATCRLPALVCGAALAGIAVTMMVLFGGSPTTPSKQFAIKPKPILTTRQLIQPSRQPHTVQPTLPLLKPPLHPHAHPEVKPSHIPTIHPPSSP